MSFANPSFAGTAAGEWITVQTQVLWTSPGRAIDGAGGYDWVNWAFQAVNVSDASWTGVTNIEELILGQSGYPSLFLGDVAAAAFSGDIIVRGTTNAGVSLDATAVSAKAVAVYTGSSNDTIKTGGGADYIVGGGGFDNIQAGGGADNVVFYNGTALSNATVDGGAGVDNLVIFSGAASQTINDSAFSNKFNLEALNLAGFAWNNLAAAVNTTLNLGQNAGNAFGQYVWVTLSNGSALAGATNTINASGLGAWQQLIFNSAASIDIVTGGAGNDVFNGGAGDTYNGGAGDDRFVFASSAALAGATVIGGAGYDTVEIADGVYNAATLSNPPDGGLERLLLGGAAASATLIAQDAQAFTLANGVRQIDIAKSAAGGTMSLTANAALGADSLITFSSTSTTLTYVGMGNNGRAAFTLGDGAHDLSFGSGNDTITFTTLAGLAATAAGGGSGFDTIILGDAIASVTDAAFGAPGIISNFESLVFTATGTITATFGNNALGALNNLNSILAPNASSVNYTLTGVGNSSVVLTGTAGADTLTNNSLAGINFVGNGGADILTGGAAADTFNFANAQQLSQAAVVDGAGGYDTVAVGGQGIWLGAFPAGLANVEALQLTGTGAVSVQVNDAVAASFGGHIVATAPSATGFNFDASGLTGTNRVTVAGTAGVDQFSGGAGNDVFTGLGAGDAASGGAGNDFFSYTTAAGFAAKNSLNGGAGADYAVILAGGTITDQGFANSFNVETLELAGAGNYTVTLGNNAANMFDWIGDVRMTGSGSLTLDARGMANKGVYAVGGNGGNTFFSSANTDMFVGGAGSDQFRFTDRSGIDFISGYQQYVPSIASSVTVTFDAAGQGGGVALNGQGYSIGMGTINGFLNATFGGAGSAGGVIDNATYAASSLDLAGSGYGGAGSGNNGWVHDAVTFSSTGGLDFDFQSFSASGAWQDGITLRVTGSLDGAAVASQDVVLGNRGVGVATGLNSQFNRVDSVTIAVLGAGTSADPLYGAITSFGIDDLVFDAIVSDRLAFQGVDTDAEKDAVLATAWTGGGSTWLQYGDTLVNLAGVTTPLTRDDILAWA
ncbi:MAG: hypothetical protein K2X11_04125 [Acetobacteraceae bacterium]|nr:hypothetical protein [Acetobacteraceae bacterium]